LALPRRAVILRTLEVPVAEDKDLAGLIGYELEQHLPFSPEDAYWAFQTMGREGTRLRVLLAAARKSDVDPHLERLDAAGLRPDAVTVSVLSAANALLARTHRRDAAVRCIVEQSGSEAEVTVLQGGSVLSSRAVPADGESGASIVAEIERAETAAGAPAAVWMAGSDEVRDAVARGLQRAVKRWDAPARVAPSSYGAALQGLRRPPFRMDLLPAERRPPTREPALRALFVLLPGVLLLGGALLAGHAYRERQTLERFRADVATVRAEAAKVETLKTLGS
jgi:hypothetical protein